MTPLFKLIGFIKAVWWGSKKKEEISGDVITYCCIMSNGCLWVLELAVLFDRQHKDETTKLLNASVGKDPNLSLELLAFITEQLSGIDDDSRLPGAWHL